MKKVMIFLGWLLLWCYVIVGAEELNSRGETREEFFARIARENEEANRKMVEYVNKRRKDEEDRLYDDGDRDAVVRCTCGG